MKFEELPFLIDTTIRRIAEQIIAEQRRPTVLMRPTISVVPKEERASVARACNLHSGLEHMVMWECKYGPVAGYGQTPAEACRDFDRAFGEPKGR